MTKYILRENVLSDNYLILADKNETIKGYKAVIVEFIFQNPYSDKKTYKKFRKIETLDKYLSENYPEFYY